MQDDVTFNQYIITKITIRIIITVININIYIYKMIKRITS